MSEQRKTICLCGALAGGKTTLIRGLSRALDGASMLLFDDYEAYGEWPSDMAAWLAEGCDPSQVRVPRLRQDLEALLCGEPVKHPKSESPIPPSDILFVEDPFGRTRPDIQELYDLVLYVELPPDLSVVRMAQRALGLGLGVADSPFDALSRDELMARCRTAQGWLSNYAALRDMYTVLAEPVRASADVFLDGRKAPDELLADALLAIRERGYGR